MYVKDGGDECKFFCLENNMVSLIEENINFWPFRVLLDDINAENIEILKLAYVGLLLLFYLMTPKQIVLVQSSKGVRGYEIDNQGLDI